MTSYEKNGVKVQVVGMNGGDWLVCIRDGECVIIDEQGRLRLHSGSHEMTGVHLAMALNDRKFIGAPNADAALKKAAEEFMMSPIEIEE